MSELQALDERVSKLEGLFKYSDNGVILDLSNESKSFSVKVGAIDGAAGVWVESANHLVGVLTTNEMGGYMTYYKPSKEAGAAQGLFVDENGYGFAQSMSPGDRIYATPFGLVVEPLDQAMEEAVAALNNEESAPEPDTPQRDTKSVFKPKG